VQYDHEEMQEILGRSFAVEQDVDEDELMGELDLIEDELALEAAAPAAQAHPAFLDEPDLPAAPQAVAPHHAERPLGASAQ
jgi:charged multivesicular body protein 5